MIKSVFLVVAAFSCLIHISQNLVIKQRSKQDSKSLKQADQALQRQKRHIGRAYEDEFEDMYAPYEVYRDSYDPSISYYPMLEDSRYGGYDEIPSMSSKERKPSKSVPSREELEAIFGPLNRATERAKKRQVSDSLRERANSEGSKQKGSSGKISESKLQEMLSEAEKDNSKTKAMKRSEGSNSKKEVNKEDLNDIFGESDKMDKRDADSSKTESAVSGTKEDIPESIDSENVKNTGDKSSTRPSESERVWELYNNMNLVTGVKKKRSENNAYAMQEEMSQALLDLTRRVADLEDDNARLRLVRALEDKENDLLASALKEATLGQLQGTDQYLQGEYGDIDNAIRVEEVLQELKSNKDSVDIPPEEDDGDEIGSDAALAPYRALDQKRASSMSQEPQPYEDSMGRWYDAPVDISGPDNDEDENQALEQYVKKYIDGKNLPEEDGGLLSYLEDEAPEDNVEGEEKELNMQDMDTCREIRELSNDCALAVEAGLDVDDEAKDLCIRHQICYTCGGTLDMSQGRCDNGYRGEVVSMCDGRSSCIRSGANFLLLMKEGHTYNPTYNNMCDSSCVKDFIVGV